MNTQALVSTVQHVYDEHKRTHQINRYNEKQFLTGFIQSFPLQVFTYE